MAGEVGNIRVDDRVIMLFNGHSSLATWKDRITNTTGSFFNGITYSDGGLTGDGVNQYFIYDVINMTGAFTYTIVGKSTNATWNTYAGLGSSRQSGGLLLSPTPSSRAVDFRFKDGTPTGYPTITTYTPSNIQQNNIYTLSTNNVNTHKAYFNGTLLRTYTIGITPRPDFTNIELNILHDDNQIDRFTDGNIKYIAIHSGQLTDDEVYELHSIIRKQIPL